MKINIGIALMMAIGYNEANPSYETKVSRAAASPGIIKGVEARPGQFPYQVSIQAIYIHPPFPYVHFCGGAIIGKRHILTAAHCLDEVLGLGKWELKVIAGTLFNEKEKFEETAQVRFVESKHAHPKWNRLENDIGIVTLNVSLEFNNFVSPIDLPQKYIEPVGDCVTTGWEYGAKNQDILNYVEMDIFNHEYCKSAYEKYDNDAKFTHGMFCAGKMAGRKGYCRGDYGGPVACKSEQSKYLCGITPFGNEYNIKCAVPEAPNAYTDVAYYSDWIHQIIAEN